MQMYDVEILLLRIIIEAFYKYLSQLSVILHHTLTLPHVRLFVSHFVRSSAVDVSFSLPLLLCLENLLP
jgi:hypothetical protein